MRYQVKKQFRVRTSEGEMELQPGQVVTLSRETALQLINSGKVVPMGRVAYRVYSEILQACLWVVETDEDMKSLRNKNFSEPIYTADEIRKLKGIDREDLKKVHRVKEVFEDSKIEEFQKKNREEES